MAIWQRRSGSAGLGDAVRRAASKPSDRARSALLHELARSSLVLASREPVSLDVDAAGRLRSAADCTLLTSHGPDGECLLVFTSEAEMRRRSPQAHPLVVPLLTVSQLVARDARDGVIINSAGPWVFVSQSEIAEAVAVGNSG